MSSFFARTLSKLARLSSEFDHRWTCLELKPGHRELRGYRTILSAQHPLASLFYNSTVLAMGRFNLWHNKYNCQTIPSFRIEGWADVMQL